MHGPTLAGQTLLLPTAGDLAGNGQQNYVHLKWPHSFPC